MTWKKLGKGLLFLFGMTAGATTGNLFYLERYGAGGAMFALTALFLFFAMSELIYVNGDDAEYDSEELSALRKTLGDLSLLVAENAINGAKHIGRTLPYTPAELTELEETLMPLLAELRADHKERTRLLQEFEKLRTRSRQTEGRRVLGGVLGGR